MFDFETVIIGAGVLGLAIARELARRGQEVLVLDQEIFWYGDTFAQQ